jgi:hypothetical protein
MEKNKQKQRANGCNESEINVDNPLPSHSTENNNKNNTRQSQELQPSILLFPLVPLFVLINLDEFVA